MKYLLSWVLSHLKNKDLESIDSVENIIKNLSNHTAEISLHKIVKYSDLNFGIGVIINNNEDLCLVQYNNKDQIIQLKHRPGAVPGMQYLITSKNNNYKFASTSDFNSEKNTYLPPLSGLIEDNIAYIKNKKDIVDYILEIENTSINNRIDLFSHRGLARELAAIYDLELIPESDILYKISDRDSNNLIKENIFEVDSENLISTTMISVKCKETYSHIEYIFSLSPLNISCHSFLVDLSNYVMFDMGQPLHLFDANCIEQKLLYTDKKKGDFISLDNTIIQIEEGSLVIIDANKEIQSLVGIMGGKKSSISENTKTFFLESAAIKPSTIRRSIKKYSKRSDSAIRSERAAIPQGPFIAMKRFLFLLSKYFPIKINELQNFIQPIFDKENFITIFPNYINKIIGNTITVKTITSVLKNLGLIITKENADISITVQTPWWRQDLYNQDDIAEEVIRIIGFNKVIPISPELHCQYKKYNNKKYTLKLLTSIIFNSNEVVLYGIENNDINQNWKYSSNNTVSLVNGYSTIQNNLMTSNLPSLLHILYQNITKKVYKEYSIFTISPVWLNNKEKIIEKNTYSVIFYQENYQKSFYDYKKKIEQVFLGLNIIFDFYSIQDMFEKQNLYSSIAANISYNNVIVGHCGFINPINFHFATKKRGVVFACEIDISSIFTKKNIKKNYQNFFDISILIPDITLSENLTSLLYQAFNNIIDITIIDWYQANEWVNKKSITLRIFTMHADPSYEYQEIKKYLSTQGYCIR